MSTALDTDLAELAEILVARAQLDAREAAVMLRFQDRRRVEAQRHEDRRLCT